MKFEEKNFAASYQAHLYEQQSQRSTKGAGWAQIYKYFNRYFLLPRRNGNFLSLRENTQHSSHKTLGVSDSSEN